MVSLLTVLLLWMVPSLLGQGDIPASSLRLVTKGERTAPYLVAGRVEVLHNGRWGTICSKGFERIDAQVLCQKLTGPSSSILRYGEVGSFGLQFDQAPSTAPVLLENLQCTTVGSICQHSGFGNTDCSHDRDIAISCQAPGAIRLQNNSFTRDNGPAGRLEVFVSTTAAFPWVSICAPDGIDQSAADVACRQLGYERAYDYGGAVSLGFRRGSGFFTRRFQCSSSDLLLNNCTFRTTSACQTVRGLDQFVAVSCINPGTSLSAAQIFGIVFGILIIIACCVIAQIAGLVSFRNGACRSSTGRPSSNRHAPQNNQLNSPPYTVGHYPSSSQQQPSADNGRIDSDLAVAVEPSAPPLEAAVTHAGEAPPAYNTVVQYKTVDLDTEDPNVQLSKDLTAQFSEHPTSTLTEPGAPPAYS